MDHLLPETLHHVQELGVAHHAEVRVGGERHLHRVGTEGLDPERDLAVAVALDVVLDVAVGAGEEGEDVEGVEGVGGDVVEVEDDAGVGE